MDGIGAGHAHALGGAGHRVDAHELARRLDPVQQRVDRIEGQLDHRDAAAEGAHVGGRAGERVVPREPVAERDMEPAGRVEGQAEAAGHGQ